MVLERGKNRERKQRKENRKIKTEKEGGRNSMEKRTKTAEFPSCKQQTKGLCHQQLLAFDVYCI